MSFRASSAALWFVSALFIVNLTIAALIVEPSRLPLIGNMLSRPLLADRATPILILALFAWILIELALKYQQVRREHASVAKFQNEVAKADLNASLPSVLNKNGTRAIRRADLVVECSRRNPSTLHEALPAVASLDASALARSYGPLNVYAWILPVLGFIGTASGMASAIDGFRDALRGGQGQIEALATQLSQSVIPGLSAAFETTILALAATLVTYLCTTALRSWDQQALDELDRLCVNFLAHLPHRDSSAIRENIDVSSIGTKLDQISNQLGEILEAPKEFKSAIKLINAATDSFVTISEDSTKALRTLDAAASALMSASDNSNSAAHAMEKAADALTHAAKDFHEAANTPYNVTITRGPTR